jgi:two-component system chemotaxis response regulator CheY
MGVDKSLNVLVVDEHRDILDLHRTLLRDMGFTAVRTATSGRDALQKLRSAEYSTVIADWRLEPMSGLELLQAVRADDELKTIAFIMVTAKTQPEDVLAAKAAGVDGYIAKPFTAAKYARTLTAVLPLDD